MKKQQTIMMVITLSIISLLAVPVFAEIKTVSLHVDGLSCPFCALSLEKKLKNVNGVVQTNKTLCSSRFVRARLCGIMDR